MNDVIPHSPVANVGIAKGDVIIKAESDNVNDANTLKQIVANSGISQNVTFSTYEDITQSEYVTMEYPS